MKLPPVTFTKPERGYAKDCWVVKQNPEDEEEVGVIMTICKSSTDEYLNGDCLIPKRVKKTDEDGEEIEFFKVSTNSTKIKAQEIDLNYPCLVSNIGLSRVMIQSLTCPDQVNSFKLDAYDMEFVSFVSYNTLRDVGFVDKRDALSKSLVPFNETGDKIGFMTRHFNVEDGEFDKGEMLLNILSIDSYSTPMRFELYTTKYEAAMDEGMSDDSIQVCFASEITSVRGLDVAFIAQYNDRIIMDCITSTKQLPIRFPMPTDQKEAAKWKKEDPDF